MYHITCFIECTVRKSPVCIEYNLLPSSYCMKFNVTVVGISQQLLSAFLSLNYSASYIVQEEQNSRKLKYDTFAVEEEMFPLALHSDLVLDNSTLPHFKWETEKSDSAEYCWNLVAGGEGIQSVLTHSPSLSKWCYLWHSTSLLDLQHSEQSCPCIIILFSFLTYKNLHQGSVLAVHSILFSVYLLM